MIKILKYADSFPFQLQGGNFTLAGAVISTYNRIPDFVSPVFEHTTDEITVNSFFLAKLAEAYAPNNEIVVEGTIGLSADFLEMKPIITDAGKYFFYCAGLVDQELENGYYFIEINDDENNHFKSDIFQVVDSQVITISTPIFLTDEVAESVTMQNIIDSLAFKADLVDGKVPLSQLPEMGESNFLSIKQIDADLAVGYTIPDNTFIDKILVWNGTLGDATISIPLFNINNLYISDTQFPFLINVNKYFETETEFEMNIVDGPASIRIDVILNYK